MLYISQKRFCVLALIKGISVSDKMMLLVFVVLASLLSINVFAATDWRGGTDIDWFNAANWFGGAVGVPTSAEWADIRSAAWVPNQPVIAGTSAIASNIRINAYAARS